MDSSRERQIRENSWFSGCGLIKLAEKIPSISKGNAFVFSGQGGAYAGMGAHYQSNKVFLSVIQRADDFCMKKKSPTVSDFLFKPNPQIPFSPETPCLALFSFQFAAAKVLVSEGIKPQFVTGHSFGEYAALVMSGSLTFEQGLEIVFFREINLPKKNQKGYLIAIRSSLLDLKKFLPEGHYHIALLNSPSQVVIGVKPEHQKDIETCLRKEKVPFSLLPVPQPFHTPLLDEFKLNAKSEYSKFCDAKKPIIPCFSGVLGSYLSRENMESQIKEICINQVTQPVDFTKQVQELRQVATRIFELGPSRKTIELIRDDKTLHLTDARSFPEWQLEKRDSIFDLAQNNQGAPLFQSKLLRIVNRTISQLTGYEIQSIEVTDRFQEDLGIDSIKLMEISVKIADELELGTTENIFNSPVKSVKDLLLNIQSIQSDKSKRAKKTRDSKFMILEPFYKQEVIKVSDEEKKDMAKSYLWIDLANKSQMDELYFSLEGKRGVVFYIARDDKALQHSTSQILEFFYSLQDFLKHLKKKERIKVGLVCKESNSLMGLALASFFRTLKIEGEFLSFSFFVCDEETWNQNEFKEKISIEVDRGTCGEIRFEKGKRFEKQFRPVVSFSSKKKSGGNAFIVGGLTGITFEIIRRLDKPKEWYLYFLGRRERSHDEIRGNISALERLGFIVDYEQADATQKEALFSCFEEFLSKRQKCDLLIHSAGVQLSKRFIDKETQDIRTEFETKTLPALWLSQLPQFKDIPRKVLHSSVVSHFGNHGQAIYGAANSWCEELWSSTQDKKSLALIAWPPWDKVGMTQDRIVDMSLNRTGLAKLGEKKGEKFFWEIQGLGRTVLCTQNDLFLYQFLNQAVHLTGFELSRFGPVMGSIEIQGYLSKSARELFKDHSPIPQVPIIPLSLVILWFEQSIRHLIKADERLEFESIVILRKIEVREEKLPLLIRVTREFNKKENYVLNLSDPLGLIAQASLKLKPTKQAHESFITKTDGKWEELPDQLDLYGVGSLFHGNDFQFVKSIFISDNNTAQSRVLFSGHHPWCDSTLWVLILESCLQTLGGVLWRKFQFAGLPVGIERFICDKNIEETSEGFLVSLDKLEVHEEQGRGNLTVYNTKGRVVCNLKGAKFKSVAQPTG